MAPEYVAWIRESCALNPLLTPPLPPPPPSSHPRRRLAEFETFSLSRDATNSITRDRSVSPPYFPEKRRPFPRNASYYAYDTIRRSSYFSYFRLARVFVQVLEREREISPMEDGTTEWNSFYGCKLSTIFDASRALRAGKGRKRNKKERKREKGESPFSSPYPRSSGFLRLIVDAESSGNCFWLCPARGERFSKQIRGAGNAFPSIGPGNRATISSRPVFVRPYFHPLERIRNNASRGREMSRGWRSYRAR